jgi:hypothetical protein
VEKALERRLILARQDRANLLASLKEHVGRHQC